MRAFENRNYRRAAKCSAPCPIHIQDLPLLDVAGSYWTDGGAEIFAPNHDTCDSSNFFLVLSNPASQQSILLSPSGKLYRAQ